MINCAGTPEEMGERYAKVADAARMQPMPVENQFNYVFAMLTEQEKLEIREAYYEDGFDDGMEKGLVTGEEKGRAANRVENAQAMLADKMAPELVAKYTGLSRGEVEALLQ